MYHSITFVLDTGRVPCSHRHLGDQLISTHAVVPLVLNLHMTYSSYGVTGSVSRYYCC